VLTKSVAGFVPALAAIVSLAVSVPRGKNNSQRERRIFFSRFSCDRTWFWIVLLPAITFFAYALVLWFVAGVKALNVFIGVEIFTRALSGFEGHNTGERWFYLRSLFVRGAAVPPVLLVTGVCGALLALKNERALRFLLVWAGLPVILYSLAASKVPWYLNPFLPFVSMLAVAGTRSLLVGIAKRWGKKPARFIFVLIFIATAPAFARAVVRNVETVLASTERIELDKFVESLLGQYSQFVIVENALSGRTNPRLGKFNVEGIYRQMLKPGLRTVATVEEFTPIPNEVVLVKQESLSRLPVGWRQLGSLAPFNGREWVLYALVYDRIGE